jgi:hypothetical protein
MYVLLGISLALATFFTLNVLATAVISLFWRIAEPLARRWSARTRAECLFCFARRGTAVVIADPRHAVRSAYVGYEPHGTSEVVSKKLAAFAIISIVGVGFALWRGFQSWIATQENWQAVVVCGR